MNLRELLYDTKVIIGSFISDIRIYKGGIILFGDSSYAIKGEDVRNIINIINPGDIVLRRYSHYVGSLAIPGYFSHVGIYVGNDKVIHVMGDGLKTTKNGMFKEDILTFTRCDSIAILRLNDSSLINNAITTAYDLFNKEIPYDFDFSNDTSKMYCTELVNFCIDNKIRKYVSSKKIILPDALLEIPELFTLVWRK